LASRNWLNAFINHWIGSTPTSTTKKAS